MAAEHGWIIYEQGVKVMAEEEGTGSNVVWALALVIIVAIIAAVFFYSGGLLGSQDKKIDVEIKVPAR